MRRSSVKLIAPTSVACSSSTESMHDAVGRRGSVLQLQRRIVRDELAGCKRIQLANIV